MDKHFQTLDRQLEHQDWKPVIINKKGSKDTSSNTTKTTSKKLSDKQQCDIKLLKQADNDELKHKKVPPEVRKQIQQKRGSLKWTQKQLAQKVNLQVSIINDIETGKATYNPQHITKIKRILKI
jgi:ribosome-binding protein aMBF1 (putative translation factor)